SSRDALVKAPPRKANARRQPGERAIELTYVGRLRTGDETSIRPMARRSYARVASYHRLRPVPHIGTNFHPIPSRAPVVTAARTTIIPRSIASAPRLSVRANFQAPAV